MYIFVVEHWSAKIGFKSIEEAERFVEIMYGEDAVSTPTISTVLLVGE